VYPVTQPAAFVVVEQTDPCTGVVLVQPFPVLKYECSPISIPAANYFINSKCGCSALQLEIVTLPQHGILSIDNVAVSNPAVLGIKYNGKIAFTKTPAYVGADSFTIKLKASCGNSDTITVNIDALAVDCTTTGCSSC
jgi:hypothetical protein